MRRPSARLRLTLIYAGLFVLAGGMLLTLNYVWMQQRFAHSNARDHRAQTAQGSDRTHAAPSLDENSRRVREEALRQLLVQSGVALGGMAALSAGLGWVVAGRVLKPVHEITATARRISESKLKERIALGGPDDEFKELADTFDQMLARLDAAFESQKRFAANASHELRTPLSIIRTELDVTLSNPEVSQAELQEMAEVVRKAIARSERLIDSLLILARSETGLPEPSEIDLAVVTREVLRHVAPEAHRVGVSLRDDLSPVVVKGDLPLLERLAGNLMDNAVVYNHEGGWIDVTTRQTREGAELRVTNSGPPVPSDAVEDLFQPFRRVAPDRTSSANGVGLGLSIVRAVATAHGGQVVARPGASGGLDVVVRLPPTPAGADARME